MRRLGCKEKSKDKCARKVRDKRMSTSSNIHLNRSMQRTLWYMEVVQRQAMSRRRVRKFNCLQTNQFVQRTPRTIFSATITTETPGMHRVWLLKTDHARPSKQMSRTLFGRRTTAKPVSRTNDTTPSRSNKGSGQQAQGKHFTISKSMCTVWDCATASH